LDTRTPDQLRNLTSAQEIQITGLEERIRSYQTQLEEAERTIANLRRFEANHHEYLRVPAEWNQMIAHSDPENFIYFFNYIAEEHVEQLVREAWMILERVEGIMEQVRTMNNMDAAHVGAVLERYLLLQPDLPAEFLRRMGAARRGEILDTLEEDVAATLILRMTPPEPRFAPLLAPHLLLPPMTPGTIPSPVVSVEDGEEEEYNDEAATDEDDEIVAEEATEATEIIEEEATEDFATEE